jgi:hypothetical protein
MKTTAQKSIAKGGRAPVPLELEKASQGSRPSSRLPAVARPRVRARSLVARRDRRATNRRGARRPRSTDLSILGRTGPHTTALAW